MRYVLRSSLIALAVAGISLAPTAQAQQFSLNISTPNVSIGINVPTYPDLVVVPGYPVYYAPQLPANYFFYDGLYWVYVNDGWYASDWYNGPWSPAAPEVVPDYILRVPVRYYRVAPPYFHAWSVEAPPHWGEHWGPTWQQRRAGWDRSVRTTAPPPAPLPTYQRAYSGSRYPSFDEQTRLHAQNYRYEPRDAVVREAYTAQRGQRPVTRNEPPGQREQQQRQAAAQRDQERKDSERESQRRTAERRDDQQRQPMQQHEQQRRDAEQQRQAASEREPQRRQAEHEQQQRQAAQQQREQQQRRAPEQRELQPQASREKEALPHNQPAPQQHARLSREPDVQSAERTERGTPPPSHQREREPRKNVEKSQNADDDSKGNRK